MFAFGTILYNRPKMHNLSLSTKNQLSHYRQVDQFQAKIIWNGQINRIKTHEALICTWLEHLERFVFTIVKNGKFKRACRGKIY